MANKSLKQEEAILARMEAKIAAKREQVKALKAAKEARLKTIDRKERTKRLCSAGGYLEQVIGLPVSVETWQAVFTGAYGNNIKEIIRDAAVQSVAVSGEQAENNSENAPKVPPL